MPFTQQNQTHEAARAEFDCRRWLLCLPFCFSLQRRNSLFISDFPSIMPSHQKSCKFSKKRPLCRLRQLFLLPPLLFYFCAFCSCQPFSVENWPFAVSQVQRSHPAFMYFFIAVCIVQTARCFVISMSSVKGNESQRRF